MHEASLAKSLLEQATAVAAQHRGWLAEILVEIGPLSGVEPELLAAAFQRLATADFDRNVGLQINTVPLRATCQDCRIDFEIPDFHFVCRECGSRRVRVTQGDGLILKQVTVQQPDCSAISA